MTKHKLSKSRHQPGFPHTLVLQLLLQQYMSSLNVNISVWFFFSLVTFC